MAIGERLAEPRSRRAPEPEVEGRRSEQPLPAPAVRTRRSARSIALGVLAIVLGGLGAAALFDRATTQEQVLVVIHDLPRGAIVEADDLGVAGIGTTAAISHVPADDLDQLIGQTALIDLAAGSVLPAAAIGPQSLAPGQSRLGLRLLPGRLPAAPLTPGDRVSLIAVPPPSGGSEPIDDPPVTITATVSTAPSLAPDQSSWLVDVEVRSADARQVAELAATDRIAVVREGD